MKKTTLLGIILIMIILTSCQKRHDSPKSYLKLVKQIEIYYPHYLKADTLHFYYDNEQRLIKQTVVGVNNSCHDFEYYDDMIVSSVNYQNKTIIQHIVTDYFLKNNRVIECVIKNETGDTIAIKRYEYNSQDELILTDSENGNYMENTWEDGNLVQQKTNIDIKTIGDSDLTHEALLEFTLNPIINKTNYEPLLGVKWINEGKTNKNLIASVSGRTFYNSSIDKTLSYELDNDDCPIKVYEMNMNDTAAIYDIVYR